MRQDKKRENYGRPPRWGELLISRPRFPLDIVAEIDRIRDQFTSPEDAQQYILDCLTRKIKMQRLKLYDCRVSASPGITAVIDNASYEEREVPLSFLKRPEKSFLVRVVGDSMEDAGIRNGDFLIAEEMNPLFEEPQSGAIVIAVVNDQLLVKRYRHSRNGHELLSENRRKKYPSILISSDASDQYSIYIFGIFQRVISNSLIDRD
jgi:SOS-response transcriptional repressor LexA